jgi:hypothetical protein
MVQTPFRRLSFAVTLALVGAVGGVVTAAPGDPQPGATLATVSPTATTLRAGPQFTAKTVASLPQRTPVTVIEVPGNGWMKVNAQVAGRSVEGWLRTTNAAPPGSIPTSPNVVAGGPRAVSQEQISAAGRRFDAETERRYRGAQPNLGPAYQLVDRMQLASEAFDPAEVEAFVRAGQLAGGRPVRPGPLKDPNLAALANKPEGPKAKDVADVAGGLAERLGFGNKRTREMAGAAVGGLGGYFQKLNEKFDPVQEYYLGRAVAANAIAQSGLDPDVNRRLYVQLLGQAIVRTTTRLRPTLGGYHFDVLNSDDVNGVSGPGGFVLVTRGAVKACRNEDELAGILMHELAHVQGNHGEQVIKQSGALNEILGGVGGVAGAAIGSEEAKQVLANVFDKVVGKMITTSMEHSYGSALENASDIEGSYLLAETGFDYWALRDSLRNLATAHHGHRHAGATHAPPQARAAYLDQVLSRSYQAYGYPQAKAAREARFRERMGLPAGSMAGGHVMPPR